MACLVNYVRKKCFHFAELELLYIEMIERAPVSCLVAQAALYLPTFWLAKEGVAGPGVYENVPKKVYLT